jgi:hypothetical protein
MSIHFWRGTCCALPELLVQEVIHKWSSQHGILYDQNRQDIERISGEKSRLRVLTLGRRSGRFSVSVNLLGLSSDFANQNSRVFLRVSVVLPVALGRLTVQPLEDRFR